MRAGAILILAAVVLAGCSAPPSTDPTPATPARPSPIPFPSTPPTGVGAPTGGAPAALSNLAVDVSAWELDAQGPRPVREFGEDGSPALLFRAPQGTRVVAPIAGVVRVSGERVELPFAARTVVLLGVAPSVSDGSRLQAGDPLGEVGADGLALALVSGERAFCPMGYATAAARATLGSLYERWREATGDESAYVPGPQAQEGCRFGEMPWREDAVANAPSAAGGQGGAPELPACSTRTPFTVPPMRLDDFAGITPLGNLNPPEHTLPTDHVYLLYERDPADQTRTLEVDVRAPGDILVLQVSDLVGTSASGVNHDFAMRFAPCADLLARFAHMTSLAPALQAAFDADEKRCTEFADPERGVTYRSCEASLAYRAAAGEMLGTGGGLASAALDLWLTDLAAPKAAVAAPQRYPGDLLHAVCPFDAFAEPAWSQLVARLGSFTTPRTAEPRCGAAFQDVPGTLAGAWFAAELPRDVAVEPIAWNRSLAFAVDAADGTTAVASLGGPMPPGKVAFTPRHEGRTDRAFEEVTPGPGAWCYEDPRAAGASRLIVEMPEAERILVEVQQGACGDGEWTLAWPHGYVR